MRKEIIKKTEEFLWENLKKSAYYQDNNQRSAEYRFEHSFRVANIGRLIAQKEGFDEERIFVACLLHDLAYSIDFKSTEEHRSHGRTGAKLARPFLYELGYSKEEVEEMCYGIAIHVDDVADFEHERTPLALTIGDADNIDRFDAFRLYEGLHHADYMNLSILEQANFLQKRISRLIELKSYPCGTKTAESMWQEKVDYQIEFLRKLQNQVNYSSFESVFKSNK